MGNQAQDIKCGSCEKTLLRNRFSNNAIKKYEQELYKVKGGRSGDSPIKLPNCRVCTGEGRNEMFCQGCQKSYTLDKFFKAQRQKSDDAKCKACAQEAEDRVADVKDAIEEQKILDQLENPSVTNIWSTSTMQGSLPSATPGTTISNTGRTASIVDSEEVWINPDQSYGGRGGRPAKEASNLDGGYDEQHSDSDQTHSTMRNLPTAMGRQSNGGWGNSTPIERAWPGRHTHSTTSSSGNFVKQGAVQRTAIERAEAQRERDRTKKAQADEEDDSDAYSEDDDEEDAY